MKFFRLNNFRNVFLRKRYYHSANGIYGHQPNTSNLSNLQEISLPDLSKLSGANANFYHLVQNFRQHGHRAAQINPLILSNNDGKLLPELSLETYNLNSHEALTPDGLVYWKESATHPSFSEVYKTLQEIYSGHVGFEYMYIENASEREWFTQQVETVFSNQISDDYKVKLGLELLRCQNFDHFLASKFPTLKRYGGEGCESMVGFFMELLQSSNKFGIDHLIIGMPHRGRLNLMSGLLQFPPSRIFQKVKGFPEFPTDALASGDVLSHLYTTLDLEESGNKTHISLLPNPSHLEAVNPVVIGKVRAKLKDLQRYDYSDSNFASNVLGVQVHGDGAIIGQGINQETLAFANVPHFRVGGSIHLIVNNQIGFTTPPDRARSSRYSSDVAKIIGAPVIHINGDYPENVVKATQLALSYRQKFQKDIFLDLLCFRKHGHNEMDDPTFTNPILYNIIQNRRSVPDQYSEQLVEKGLLNKSQVSSAIERHSAFLKDEFAKADTLVPPHFYLQKQWSGFSQGGNEITTWDTGVSLDLLKFVGAKSVNLPQDFNVHGHLAKTFVKSRLNHVTDGEKIDWATAESMAMGSLLYQGYNVRLSGEDVGRGTFSQRHAMFVDQKTGHMCIPLNLMTDDQIGKLEVANSILSEEAALAFEYGYSLENPSNLVIWEAQFGDFFNGAQIIVDTMVTSGETKWMLQSGLVMLLPHGMDGAGPEHSSCRIERFLQSTDSNEEAKVDGDYNNVQVVNPTTPAQYFHLLRRQMIRNFRKPMVVVAPKTLLRLSSCTSSLLDMVEGTTFLPVLDDPIKMHDPKSVKKLVFVSGKHYYTLNEKRALEKSDIALVRLESLCPFPVQELQQILKNYSNATQIVWSQEEHQNMGAWTFIRPRFENFLGKRINYVGRGPLAAPAVGVGKVHRAELDEICAKSL